VSAGGGAARFGSYEVLSLLGKGGMAEVYRARVCEGPRAGQEVALKRIAPEFAQDPAYIEQFANEADLLRLLDHPNIIRVHEVGVLQEIYFIAMELIDGRDLAQVLRRCKARGIHLPTDFALFLTRTLLDALAHAHGAVSPSGRPLEIVHCDVSPSNLFVSRSGEIKLGDFGVARAKVPSATTDFCGKPYYLSPEAFRGQMTAETDLWAATVTLYELLTLERPFIAQDPDGVRAAAERGRYRPASALRPELPPDVDQIIARGFARAAAERFASAAAYAQALAPLYDDRIGNPMAIAAVVRGLFGAED
jgi:eukaryotic-like serine/threonine-protein kinase